MSYQEKLRIRQIILRITSLKMAMVMMLTSTLFLWPEEASALTGGPTQPEVSSFSPVGTSDMVDPFSGNFNYNIPLLDVGGYPINLVYNSGISMDQEASWVGLGWNVNAGVINRTVRGLPDDFDGDTIVTTTSMKPMTTFGLTYGKDFEFFGITKNEDNKKIDTSLLDLNLGLSLGFNWNNYTGIGAEIGLNPSFSAGDKNKNEYTAGLGFNSSSGGGLSIQPSASFSGAERENKSESKLKSVAGGFQSAFNSREGLTALSVSGNANMARAKEGKSHLTYNLGGTASFDFGQPTYTPSANISKNSFGLSASFKIGAEVIGADIGQRISGYYNRQWIAKTDRIAQNRAYGYFNLENGQKDDQALLDFNRENDGAYTSETPLLPMANLTNDVFSVSGQGVGGSFRGFRNDVGHVFDNSTATNSVNGNLGIETATGNLVKGGLQVGVTWSNTQTGKWTKKNDALAATTHRQNKAYKTYEHYHLKEASEKNVSADPGYMSRVGGVDPMHVDISKVGLFGAQAKSKLVNHNGTRQTISSASTYRNQREKRNQLMNVLPRVRVNEGHGLNFLPSNSYAKTNGKNHHVCEITNLSSDGSRYVYGLPAYNTKKKEVTFAIGDKIIGTGSNGEYPYDPDCANGLVQYDPGTTATTDNPWGVDQYYNSVETPAYAHAFMLTAVISPDYQDVDGVKGPSDGDLGNYTKFHYKQVDDYKWRVPFQQNSAHYNEGLRSDQYDDKANYIYGEKELWYLDSIVTKNFIAIFHTNDREDGCGVTGEHGGLETSNRMQKLTKISLYAKPDYYANGVNAEPIKEVHFEYSYELCPDVPNNTDADYDHDGDPATAKLTNERGKLTLKKVYFTYRGSQRGKYSAYDFTYGGDNNYAYNMKANDRWGTYKYNPVTTDCDVVNDSLNTSDFPYTNQFDSATQDLYVSAWSLTEIDLPSGGKIQVEYESDDYAYVQYKQAMQMFKIKGLQNGSGSAVFSGVQPISNGTNKNWRLLFELQPGYTNISDYFEGVDNLYFRCLMEFDEPGGGTDGRYDFVSGYAKIDGNSYGQYDATTGYVDLKKVSFKDNGSEDYSPIALAGIQYGRLHLSRFVNDQPALSEDDGLGKQVLSAFVTSITNFKDGFKNPNKSIWDKERGTKIVLNKSWIRLNNVNGHKKGGGHRVKSIKMVDEWDAMTDNQMNEFTYGQEYIYELENGRSSGVAAYEPQVGGEENPFKQPITYSEKKTLAPDARFYKETPVGESFFPSANVGYSRVVIKNIDHDNVKSHATGKVVHEFYTARDFPTLVRYTPVEKFRQKSPSFNIVSLLKAVSYDMMTASQGFVIECNDMHGKQKAQYVYAENKSTPITSVEYYYQDAPNGTQRRLTNQANVINEDGSVAQAELGVFFDMAVDYRESKSRTLAPNINTHVDAFVIPFLPPIVVPIPSWIPQFNYEKTRFRSATTTKVIQRFGILEKVVATDLGSRVETKNLAYDAESGEVLLTQTQTNFEDAVYSLKYPAYWHYDGMGMAYKNIGYEDQLTFDANGVATVSDAQEYYVEGDELLLIGLNDKVWVTDVSSGSITALKTDGSPVSGSFSSEVIRSGRRNLQNLPMASITTRENPLNALKSNVYENVLQASAIEYGNAWRTYCECFGSGNNGIGPISSTNPYVLGTKGNFRPKSSYLHLSDRTQSDYNDNTNIRKDGMFKSYRPFYRLNPSGEWEIDRKDWTYTAEVTEFSPLGQELENQDALGRYSAATFGFNQTLATSVAANAQYREIGFDGFEDYDFNPCADGHFKFIKDSVTIDDSESHSGTHSIKVSSGSPATLTRQISDWCAPTACAVDIDTSYGQDGSGNDILTIVPTGGNGSYLVNWDVISGSPIINYTPSEHAIIMRLTGSYSITISYKDTDGCEVIKTISITNGAFSEIL